MISAILVEGYMDAIAVARAGIANVIASCGTSLAEPQIKLLGRFTRRVVVNYDPDTAGQAATERSLALLLEKEFDVRVLALPGGADPDKFLKEQGADGVQEIAGAGAAVSGLPDRARAQDGSFDRRGKSGRAEFSDALRAAASQPAATLGMGYANRVGVARGRTSAARSAAPGRRRAPQRSEAQGRIVGVPSNKPNAG